MITPQDRLRTLVEGLYLATDKGHIRWEDNGGSRSYVANVAENKVEILPVGNEIRINIYDSLGNEVDAFDDTIFSDLTPVNLPFPSYFQAMIALHQNARRSANGADRIIDNIISNLGISTVSDDIPF